MSLKQFCVNFFALNKKWLTRIVIALLAAFFSAGVSLAFPKIGTGDWGKGQEREKGGTSISIGLSQLPLPSSQSSIANSHQLLQQGAEFFQAEQYSAAATVWQQAVSVYKTSGDKLNQAQALELLSLAYQQLGKWQEAESAIASSLSLIRTLGRNKNTELILAKALNTQGHLQLALGQSDAALKSWQQAATTYSQVGDTEGKIGSQINVAQALQSLGNYRQARKTLEQVETFLETQPNSPLKATGLRSLGNALRGIGELEESRKLLQQSLIIAEELRSPIAISAAYFSLGNTIRASVQKARESKDSTETEIIEEALKAYQQAVQTSRSPIMRSLAQVNQLSLLVDNQQISEALSLRSQIQIDELPPSRPSVYARIYLAQSLLRLKTSEEILALGNASEETCTDSKRLLPHISPDREDKEILAWADIGKILATAVQQARSLKDTQAESYALGHLGELYALTGQSKQSIELTQQALVLAQGINASDISYRWQWRLGQLLEKQGDSKGAIAAYSVAVETLKSLRSDLAVINPDNPDIQFSFRESVEPVYRELVNLLTTTEGEPSQEELRQARLTIESLQLATLDNFFQEPCLDAKPVQIDQIDATAAVIYPIILPDRLAVIVALPQNELPLRYYATLKPKCEIEKLLDELQQDIGRLAGNNDRVLQLSQQVYDWIIRPAEAELKNSKVETLVFVLDGLLRNVPIAALHDGKQYLIEKYSIALTPGLQLLPPQPLKREQLRALTAGLSEANQNYSPLPYVKPELEGIQKLLNSQLLLNQEFTENNLQQALNSVPFPVVHIATHGQFSSQADKTFIVTWNSQINVKEFDNLLRRREQEKSRPIELLVLSACETADGDNRAALGLAGVAVRAGARSTLATLWRVNDKSTATLMVKFYQELAKEGVSKAQALRLAQLSLLENEYKSPFYWAPFVLVGNWR